MPTTLASPDITRAARLFHALSDETRLAVLDMLGQGELCVCELQAALDAAQSRLSFHLKVLKEAGIVTDRKEGRWAYYTIAPEAIDELESLVTAMRPGLVQLTRRNGASSGAGNGGGNGATNDAPKGISNGTQTRGPVQATRKSSRGCC